MRKTANIFMLLAFAGILLSSCVKEEASPSVAENAGPVEVPFGFVQEFPEEVRTKTVINAADFESKFTSITYAAYSGGQLYTTAYYSDADGALNTANTSLTLEKGFTFTVYAFVNMGDIRSSVPSAETGIGNVVYTIPAYNSSSVSDVNTRGIPMSGSLTFKPSADTENRTIALSRLLAKVTAVLSCDWDGARITSAKIYNMNAKLKPFGLSAAASASTDLLSFQDVESGVNASSLTATFYVPENMQGVFSGITASSDKKYENGLLSSVRDRLTYIETTVTSTGKYDGTVKYRSYLGANATSNFNVERNKHYTWTINYHSVKVDDYDNDWKHDFGDGFVVRDYEMTLSPNPGDVNVGSTFAYTTMLNSKTLEPTETDSWSQLSNNSCTWVSSNPAVASVSNGVVTGAGQGTATVTAYWTPGGYDNVQISASAVVNVHDVVTHSLVVSSASGYSVSVGTPIDLTATYYTYINGVQTASEDVTSSATWTKLSGEASVSVSNAAGTKGRVSATSNGSAVVYATYSGTTSNDVTVSFSDVIEKALIISASPASQTVGNTIQLSARLQTIVNGGTPTYNDIPATSVTWEALDEGTNYANISVNASGVVSNTTGVATRVIRGTYDGATGTVTVTFTNSVGYSFSITPASSTANITDNVALVAKYYTTTNGVTDSGIVPASLVTWSSSMSSVNVSSSGNGNATVSTNGSATNGGKTATITASYQTPDGIVRSATATVTYNTVTSHRLVLGADNTSKAYNQTINLTATYYTTTNGVEDSGVAVTPASLSKTGGLNITLTAGNPSTARLTNQSLSNATNNSASVTATFAGVTSNAVSIAFTNVTTYAYTRLVVSGDASVTVSNTTGNYSVTLYTQTYVNGVASGSPATSDVSSGATFSSSNTAVATVSGRRATGVANGTTYIGASYTGTYGTVASADGDRQLLTVTTGITYALVFSNPSGTSVGSPSSLAKGGTHTLAVQLVTFTNGTETARTTLSNTSVTWSVSSTSVATVSSAGVISGVAAGDVTVTARYTPSGSSQLTAYAYVRVSNGGFDDGWEDEGEIVLN